MPTRSRQYSSFLVRVWQVSGDEQRIKVTHIQSGTETRFTSLPQLDAWLSTRVQDATSQEAAPNKEKTHV
jgi:hypothetical protein